jgi:hypothetical protein
VEEGGATAPGSVRAGCAARFSGGWILKELKILKKLASLEGHFESAPKMAKASTKHSARHAREL